MTIQPESGTGFEAKALTRARSAFVATAHPVASIVGAELLKAGGNAADAAIGIQLALTLVEPQSSGLGGGAFALVWDEKQHRITTYNARETAPSGATEDMFIGPDKKEIPFMEGALGGSASGVPGTPRLLEALHKKHGKLPWARLFKTVIHIAETGFPMSPRLNGLLAKETALKNDPAARDYFYQADGSPKPVGTRMTNPALASTFRTLQKSGVNAFYQGDIAKAILARLSDPPRPSTMTESDFKNYQVKAQPPLCANYRESTVCGMGLPSSGGIATLQMLGILQYFKIGADSVQSVHLFTQAQRLAFADRSRYVADRVSNSVVAALLDSAYLATRAALISPLKDMGVAVPGVLTDDSVGQADDASPELPSTSHFLVVDKWGNAISMTSTIEDVFGSRRMVRGFLMNNEMTDFSFVPRQGDAPVANRVEPGKRPRSSMDPIMVLDAKGNLSMMVGSPGGSQIIGYVTQVLVALMDWKQDPQAAVSAGHFGNRNGKTELEQGSAAEKWAEDLKKMGHDVWVGEMTSGLSAAVLVGDEWQIGVDPRRECTAIGW